MSTDWHERLRQATNEKQVRAVMDDIVKDGSASAADWGSVAKRRLDEYAAERERQAQIDAMRAAGIPEELLP